MIDWLIRAAGLFHLVGGLVVVRALAAAAPLDLMLAQVTGGVRPRDRIRAGLLGLGAATTVLAGAALLALDRAAIGLVVADLGLQATWLGFAARAFPPDDADDRRGRRRVVNAFLGWIALTIVVIGAAATGLVRFAAEPFVEAALAVAGLGLIAGLALHLYRHGVLGRPTPAIETVVEASADPGPFVPPKRVLLSPEVGCWPLWDADDGRNLDPWRLDLPDELRGRIADFDGRVIEALDVDHADGPSFVDARVEAGLATEAIELTRALEAVYGEDAVAWRLPDVARTP